MFIKDPDLYVGSGAGQKSSGSAALGMGKNIIQNNGRKKGQKLVNYRRSDQQSLFLPVQRKCMFTFSNKQRQNNCILNLQKKYLNKKLFLTVTKGLNKSTTATHLLFLQTSSTHETVRQFKRKTVKNVHHLLQSWPFFARAGAKLFTPRRRGFNVLIAQKQFMLKNRLYKTILAEI